MKRNSAKGKEYTWKRKKVMREGWLPIQIHLFRGKNFFFFSKKRVDGKRKTRKDFFCFLSKNLSTSAPFLFSKRESSSSSSSSFYHFLFNPSPLLFPREREKERARARTSYLFSYANASWSVAIASSSKCSLTRHSNSNPITLR